jgi:hypothetical protein
MRPGASPDFLDVGHGRQRPECPAIMACPAWPDAAPPSYGSRARSGLVRRSRSRRSSCRRTSSIDARRSWWGLSLSSSAWCSSLADSRLLMTTATNRFTTTKTARSTKLAKYTHAHGHASHRDLEDEDSLDECVDPLEHRAIAFGQGVGRGESHDDGREQDRAENGVLEGATVHNATGQFGHDVLLGSEVAPAKRPLLYGMPRSRSRSDTCPGAGTWSR